MERQFLTLREPLLCQGHSADTWNGAWNSKARNIFCVAQQYWKPESISPSPATRCLVAPRSGQARAGQNVNVYIGNCSTDHYHSYFQVYLQKNPVQVQQIICHLFRFAHCVTWNETTWNQCQKFCGRIVVDWHLYHAHAKRNGPTPSGPSTKWEQITRVISYVPAFLFSKCCVQVKIGVYKLLCLRDTDTAMYLEVHLASLFIHISTCTKIQPSCLKLNQS